MSLVKLFERLFKIEEKRVKAQENQIKEEFEAKKNELKQEIHHALKDNTYNLKELHNANKKLKSYEERFASFRHVHVYTYSLNEYEKKINTLIQLRIYIFFAKYMLKVLDGNKKSFVYLKILRKKIYQYSSVIDPLFKNALALLDNIEEELEVFQIEKDCHQLALLKHELVTTKKIPFEDLFEDRYSFDEVKDIIDTPLSTYEKKLFLFEKFGKVFKELTMHFNPRYDTSHMYKEYEAMEKALNLHWSAFNGYNGNLHKIITLKKQLDSRIQLHDDAYHRLNKKYGDELAIHGAGSLETAQSIVSHGITTGGQGGANFVVNGHAFGYGVDGGFLITKVKYLLHEAFRRDLSVSFLADVSVEFCNNKLVVSTKDKILKHNSLPDIVPDDVVLRIHKSDTIKVRVPWVLVTDKAEAFSIKAFKDYHVDIIHTKDKIFHNKSYRDVMDLLTFHKQGRDFLAKHLK